MTANPGTTVSVLLSPQLWTTPPHMDFYTISKRDCRFQHELPKSAGDLFDIYQQDNCKYECALRIVEANYTCVPWDIPYNFEMDKTELCNGPTAAKFKASLGNVTIEQCPDCDQRLCNEVSFTQKVIAIYWSLLKYKHSGWKQLWPYFCK